MSAGFLRPDDDLRWDVLEAHLLEAGFLWLQREAALASSRYSLAEVESGPEARLLAHVDALATSGREGAAALLRPALEADDAELRGAAALALTGPGEARDLAAVLKAATQADAEGRAPLLRALALRGAPELASLLEAGDPVLAAQGLEALAFRGAVPQKALDALASRPEPELRLAVMRAARVLPGVVPAELVREALDARDPELQRAALLAAAVAGDGWALEAARARLGDPGAPGGTARFLVAALGEAKELVALLDRPELRREALLALGHAGHLAGVEACLAWSGDPVFGAVAAEAISQITGLPVTGSPAEPEPPEENAAAAGPSLWSVPDDELPLADVEALRELWEQARARIPQAERLLRGRRLDRTSVLHELEHGPTWRREALCLELAIRSRGAVQIQPLAFAADQRRQTGDLRDLTFGPWR